MSEHEKQRDELLDQIARLADAIDRQATAMDELAESNRQVIDYLIGQEAEEDPDAPPSTYLDGSPVR